MKQKLDQVRTLAVQLFNAGQREKRKAPKEIWGANAHLKFENLPSETVAVLDAMAIEVYRKCVARQNNELTRLAFIWAEQDRNQERQCYSKGSKPYRKARAEMNALRRYRLKRWGKDRKP